MKYIDSIQSHILGVIVGLMNSYGLDLQHVQARYEYVQTLNPDDVTHTYTSPIEDELTEVPEMKSISKGSDWYDSDDDITDNVPDTEDESKEDDRGSIDDDSVYPLRVSTRRQFCSMMQRGIKICPRYSTCSDPDCGNFHVDPQSICPHVTRGSYCDKDGCELIVIRACRKGRKCNDSECSFRHG